jgi:uncharacterized surface protein with fasciclin (FAS1) repeats
MIKYVTILSVTILIGFSSCQDNWDEHYNDYTEEVNKNMVEHLKEIPEYSDFLNFLEEYNFDTLLYNEKAKTFFIPTNEAFASLTSEDTTGFMDQILAYHVSPAVFLSNNVQNKESKKLLTSLGKFLQIEKANNELDVDGVPLNYSSPLFKDGKYYEIAEILMPKPSIYGYLQLYNPFLQRYIDSFDTLDLDLSLSIPIGYNEEGQTVYDSVYNEYNLFEEEYFPITEEFRERTATLILYTQEQYNEAIDVMAANMGIQPDDIPEQWVNEVFLSQIFDKSVFEGSLDYEEFRPELLNINRDTSFVDPASIDPDSRFECSNGIVYNYLNFRVPEELYLAQRKYEIENYIYSLGLGRYVWDSEKVTVESDISTEPTATETSLASNDTIVSVPFKFNYTGMYSIEFTLDNVFPGDYILEWRGNYRPSGNFKVYVNSVDVTDTSPMVFTGEFDLFLFRELVLSVESGKFFIPDADRNNSIDFLVQDIINEYGNVKVKIEYQNSGSQSNNGFSIDYLSLTPYQN